MHSEISTQTHNTDMLEAGARGAKLSFIALKRFATFQSSYRHTSFLRDLLFVSSVTATAYLGLSLFVTRQKIRDFQQSTFLSRGNIPNSLTELSNYLRFQFFAPFRHSATASTVHPSTLRRIDALPLWDGGKILIKESLEKWNRLSNSTKMTGALLVVNSTLFLFWQIPSAYRFMSRHFTDSAWSTRSYTMLTCAFSHKDLFHFFANSLGLASFAPTVIEIFDEQDPGSGVWHFLAFYLSCACGSSLVSRHIRRRFDGQIQSASLGASGALYGLLAVAACERPEMKLQIIFLPGLDFSIGTGVLGLAAFDAFSILSGRVIFDHFVCVGC